MQNYVVHLESPVFTTFRCQKAANSLDIDTEKKSKHHLAVSADLAKPFNVGLIVGASGSGKTTLAKQIFGDDCFHIDIDPALPVIEQFPADMDYDACAAALSGIGLTSVPCWIRPVYTLSNGQRARAEAALAMARTDRETICIDEWTSVVDRTVAKVMSHCVQKHARRSDRRIILNSCHYDVIEWLNPDWVIDCNKQTYEDRRSMVGSFERSDRLRFDVAEVGRATWPYFSKYHYLSDRLPGGRIYTFGLFEGVNQIGFQCFAAYIIGDHKTFFSNRTVIHPDYAGLGLGIHLINETSKEMIRRGFAVKAKFSSLPIYKAMARQAGLWRCTNIDRPIRKPKVGRNLKSGQGAERVNAFRHKTTTYHFDFVWRPSMDERRA
jgi:ABC-type dipeptide/oligopeptide/nickel transport system ATPase subunit